MYRVMVVDDEKDVREALVDELSCDFHVEAFEEAEVALERLREGQFDALVSDVRMPTTNGVTLLQRAVQVAPELVRIFLTGYSDEEVRDAALELGAYKVRKPWGDELALLLHQALTTREQWSRARSELSDWTRIDGLGVPAEPLLDEREVVERTVKTLRSLSGVSAVRWFAGVGDSEPPRTALAPADANDIQCDSHALGGYFVEVDHRAAFDARMVRAVIGRARDLLRLGDLTREIRDRETELDRVRDGLIQREQLAVLGAVTMDMVHDIRSPLAVLLTNHEELGDQLRQINALEGTTAEIWNENGAAIETIRRILTSMERVAARPRDGEHVDVDHCLSLAARLMRHRVQHAAVKLRLPAASGLFVHATSAEVCQILINLLSNALDHSPRGGVVEIEVHSDADRVYARVRDEGPRMDTQALTGIFDPCRAGSAENGGIGLMVARALARRHGGELLVVNDEPTNEPVATKGACLELTLHRADGEHA